MASSRAKRGIFSDATKKAVSLIDKGLKTRSSSATARVRRSSASTTSPRTSVARPYSQARPGLVESGREESFSRNSGAVYVREEALLPDGYILWIAESPMKL